MTSTPTRDPLVGCALEGRYEIVARLARGGMATVYRAHDLRLSRTVAVKVMHETMGDDDEFVAKFDREAKSAATLSHPNVVSVFDQGHERVAGVLRPFIVMEYVQGETLRRLVSREAPVDPLRALTLLEPVLAALAAAHDAGLIHRDVKPENVLLSERGQVKVADFGLARAVTAHTATASQGVLIGTVSYLPPELVLSGRADTRSDVYSAGVVLYELLTGRKPHTGDSPIQVAWAHVHDDVPPPSAAAGSDWHRSRSAIPPYLDALVAWATRREPAERPADARAFLAGVRRARAALESGVMDDPALTRSFTSTRPSRPTATDPADATVTRVTRTDHLAATAVDGVPALSPRSAWTPDPAPSAAPFAAPFAAPSAAPPHAPTTRRRRGSSAARPARRGRLGSALVTAIALLVGFGCWWGVAGRWTNVPGGLDGIAASAAEGRVHDAGLSPAIDRVHDEKVPEGQVLDASPAPGQRLERGSTVHLRVSSGPRLHTVPDVTGRTRAQAEAALEKAQLAVGKVGGDWSETVRKGAVISTSHAGESLRRGSKVDLTLSKGPRPIAVPDLTGRPADEAKAQLEQAGFAVKVTEAPDARVPAGSVSKQSPAKGERQRGSTIELTRSTGPRQVTIPAQGVMFARTDDARRALEALNLRVKVENGFAHIGLGVVTGVTPGVGSTVAEGSEVTLSVG